MKFNQIITLSISLIVFIACRNTKHTESSNDTNTSKQEITEETPFEEQEVLFDKKQFDNSQSIDLLKEINICSDTQTDFKGNITTPCSPELFTFFPLNSTTDLKDGFILLVRANTGGFGLRRILVFERENGVLVKVNGFVANLIGTKKRNNSNDDLLLRFIDKIDGSDVFYHCVFQWENGRYVFKAVEAIHEPAGNFYGKVKESIKDSLSQEILKILTEYQMIF